MFVRVPNLHNSGECLREIIITYFPSSGEIRLRLYKSACASFSYSVVHVDTLSPCHHNTYRTRFRSFPFFPSTRFNYFKDILISVSFKH